MARASYGESEPNPWAELARVHSAHSLDPIALYWVLAGESDFIILTPSQACAYIKEGFHHVHYFAMSTAETIRDLDAQPPRSQGLGGPLRRKTERRNAGPSHLISGMDRTINSIHSPKKRDGVTPDPHPTITGVCDAIRTVATSVDPPTGVPSTTTSVGLSYPILGMDQIIYSNHSLDKRDGTTSDSHPITGVSESVRAETMAVSPITGSHAVTALVNSTPQKGAKMQASHSLRRVDTPFKLDRPVASKTVSNHTRTILRRPSVISIQF